MKLLLREFDILIAQLEHLLSENNLTLQKMVFLLQPSKITLKLLEKLIRRCTDSTGGRMLDILQEFYMEQGDIKCKELCLQLLINSSKPFLNQLSHWLFKGELVDPYKEFMIFEDVSISKEALTEDFNAQYWDSKYTLVEKQVPSMLRSCAEKALIAGKYLNVLRESNPNLDNYSGNKESLVDFLKEKELKFNPEGENSLPNVIEEAYLFSSRALLRLLEQRHGLSIHLLSLRRYFFLEHGDFFTQFMDTAEMELKLEVKDISINRIQNLLNVAISTSSLKDDPHRDDLTCNLATHNLIQHLHLIQSAGDLHSNDMFKSTQGLKGVEALTLDYNVTWPVSILLSRRSITKYQLLSRLLYFSKHVESRVLDTWKDHQNTKSLNVRSELGLSYCLRHRMLHFLQNFVYYMTVEVISPRSHEMMEHYKDCQDMDEVLDLHEKFLDTCLKECLLASQELLKILTKIMTTCLLFADQMKKFVEKSENVSGQDKNNKSIPSATGKKQKDVVIEKKNILQNKIIIATFIKSETSHESFKRM